jgi:hypothetical protein
MALTKDIRLKRDQEGKGVKIIFHVGKQGCVKRSMNILTKKHFELLGFDEIYH